MSRSYHSSRKKIRALMVIVEINFLGLMKKPEKAIYPGYEIPGEDEYSLM